MTDLSQKIIKFNYDSNLTHNDFFVSKSNKHIFDFINRWPKWEKNFLNIIGENFSGKTHLANIFLKKFKGISIEASSLNDTHLNEIKTYQNVILENIKKDINEKLIYSLINIIDQDNKYLIVTSKIPIVNIKFKLVDLNSRTKNFILQNIENPALIFFLPRNVFALM